MVEHVNISKSPFVLKRDLEGNVLKIRAVGTSGGALDASIQQTNTGLSYLVAGSNITIVSASNGQITISSTGGGSSRTFDNQATYVVLSATSSLDNERVLTQGTGITITDGGVGASVTVSINDSVVATISGSRFTGNITVVGTGSFEQGISGSLTRLTSGLSYLVGGSNVTIASTSNGQVVISATATSTSIFDASASYVVMGVTSSLANERVLTSSTGITITDAGAGGNVTIGFSDGVLATLSGSRFTGSVTIVGTGSFEQGVSGSLIRLIDGRSFITAGSNVTVTSQSNGQITISTSTVLGGQTSFSVFCSPMEISGTVETIVASAYISGTTFTSCRAMLGCGSSSDTSTLRLRRFTNGDIVLTLTGSGLLANVNSTGSLIIPADDWYNLTLTNSSTSGSAICQGVRVIV